MTTQLEYALQGQITPAMQKVAHQEGMDPEVLCQRIAAGRVVIPANVAHHALQPCGIGEGLRTKVNANLGTSTAFPHLEPELVKLQVALEAGVDAIMDLSTGGDLEAFRKRVLQTHVPIGTVPIYQAVVEASERRGSLTAMTAEDIFSVIHRQAEDGVDFITVHCGVTLEVVARLEQQGRLAGIVSRGGAFLARWMQVNQLENPLFTQYDRLLDLCREYDVTLSLGDGLRPGCLEDATDRAQLQELLLLGELVDRARSAGVQVMVEGPGHVPLNQVEANIVLQKRVCRGAPFYVLGPIVTDIAPGYDHITSAIGGALAAAAGADFLCYVTPAEHLGLPTAADVREGIMAARIAGHAADIVKMVPGAREWDAKMARARKALNWEEQIKLALDPQRAEEYRRQRNPGQASTCSMCGDFCAMDIMNQGGKCPVD